MMKAFLARAERAYRDGRALAAVQSRAARVLYGLRYTLHDPASRNVTFHWPAQVRPSADAREREFVGRLFQAFRRMKEDQRTVSPLYNPALVWQQQLDSSYAPLADALTSGSVDAFHAFLANFGAWPKYLGTESPAMLENRGSVTGRKYLTNVIFARQLSLWRWFYDGRKPITALSYPQHGNQAGALIDGTFVGPGSFFSEIYGSMLSELVDGRERPVVAELGAGFGKLAYFTLRNVPDFCYVDFDLPETLCLAAYYLSRTWPDRKVLLYGEEPYEASCHDRYDLIFMPSYAIERAGPDSVDLFLNVNSLGEMSREAALNYVQRIAPSTHYFFHMNHDVHPERDGESRPGLPAHEYPVPPERFRRLVRYPDLGHMFYKGGFDRRSDIFFYLYERRAAAKRGGPAV